MYLDHNAGGRIRPEVARAVGELLGADLANPSSVHAAGRRARDAIEGARDAVAALVGARPSEVVFTSGGTEANNLAVRGAAAPVDHLVSTAIEHVSVLRALEAAAADGARLSLLRSDAAGRVEPRAVGDALGGETALVSVGWVNGEIGTVQPIAEIAAEVRRRAGRRALVHSDAVQAASLCAIDFAATGLDLLSLSGHKLGAFPGVGALIVAHGTPLRAQILGGPQERERRAGTENWPGIVSFGAAARLAREERLAFAARAAAIGRRLWEGLAGAAAPVERLSARDALATTLSVAFPGLRGDALVLALDLAGVAASTGAACAAGAAAPSHVLRAIGCDAATVGSALRLSFGPDFDLADADRAVATIATVVAEARAALAGSAAGDREGAGGAPRAGRVGHAV